MTPAEALAAHLTQRPEMPRPFDPCAAESIAWQHAFQQWVNEKQELERAVRMDGFTVEFERQKPIVTPRADYIYREPMARKRNRPPRPAWSGATPEYWAQKKRESRAKQKARNSGETAE
jgi:hypothetical protein